MTPNLSRSAAGTENRRGFNAIKNCNFRDKTSTMSLDIRHEKMISGIRKKHSATLLQKSVSRLIARHGCHFRKSTFVRMCHQDSRRVSRFT
jgi:hypothetical protein